MTEPASKPQQKPLIDFWLYQKELVQQHYRAEHGLPPQQPDAFATGYALIPSCLPLQHIVNSIQNAASGADRWHHTEGSNPYYTGTSEAGSTIVEYTDERTSVELWEQVQSFTDLDADVLLVALAQLLKCPLENDRRSAWIFASNVLDYRGIEPIKKANEPEDWRHGHRQEDQADIARCMHRITNLWVTVNQVIKTDEEKGRGKRRKTKKTEYTERSKILTLESIWYQRELTDDNGPFPTRPPAQAPIGWQIRAGKWLEPFLENRQVAHICQQALEYDPYREMWEKRLARYFFFHFRMNARCGAFNREIGKMLETLSLPIQERYPERTRQRFEKAMKRLVEDRQIDGWEYVEHINDKARGWLHTWLAQKVRIYIAPYRSLKSPEGQEQHE
jgi:hypothetical protein